MVCDCCHHCTDESVGRRERGGCAIKVNYCSSKWIVHVCLGAWQVYCQLPFLSYRLCLMLLCICRVGSRHIVLQGRTVAALVKRIFYCQAYCLRVAVNKRCGSTWWRAEVAVAACRMRHYMMRADVCMHKVTLH
jgi:hypothetical protein